MHPSTVRGTRRGSVRSIVLGLVLCGLVGLWGVNELDKAAVQSLNTRGAGMGPLVEEFFKATGQKSHATPEARTKAIDEFEAKLIGLSNSSSLSGPGFLFRAELVSGDARQRWWAAYLHALTAAARPDLEAFGVRIAALKATAPDDPRNKELLAYPTLELESLATSLGQAKDEAERKNLLGLFSLGLRSGFGR